MPPDRFAYCDAGSVADHQTLRFRQLVGAVRVLAKAPRLHHIHQRRMHSSASTFVPALVGTQAQVLLCLRLVSQSRKDVVPERYGWRLHCWCWRLCDAIPLILAGQKMADRFLVVGYAGKLGL